MKNYNKLSVSASIEKAIPKPILKLNQKQLEQLKNFSQILLGMIAAVGVVGIAILAPNALQMLKLFEKKRSKKSTYIQRQQKLVRSFYYLKKSGQIHLKESSLGLEIFLTAKGRKAADKLQYEMLTIPKPKIWDGYFWQVAADIPTKYRAGADAFRYKLKQIGFYSLQRTLWFYPFDPRNEILVLAKEYGIDSFVTVMKISKLDLEDEKILRKYFTDLLVI